MSGPGTIERDGFIRSTLAGFVQIEKQQKNFIVTVKNYNQQTVVPTPGDIVTAKVLYVTIISF